MTNKQNHPMKLVKSRPERCPLEIPDEAPRILHHSITNNRGAAEVLVYDNYPSRRYA